MEKWLSAMKLERLTNFVPFHKFVLHFLCFSSIAQCFYDQENRNFNYSKDFATGNYRKKLKFYFTKIKH